MIYLDHSATSKMYPEVIDAVHRSMKEDFFNPASLYKSGKDLQRKMDDCFASLANILGCSAKELIQTSGATESINTALKGLYSWHGKRLNRFVALASDHDASLSCLKYLEKKGAEVILLKPNRDGSIPEDQLLESLTDKVLCVSLLYVNNESGILLDINRIVSLIRKHAPQAYIHGDFVQAWGKISFQLDQLDIDLASFSGHKIHGPKGVGLLYVRDGILLDPLIHGGGQQDGRRSGTDNLALLEGITIAAQIQKESFQARKEKVFALHEQLLSGLKELGAVENFPNAIPEIISISFPNLRGETLLHMLEENEIYLSTSSACQSRSARISHVLLACGVDRKQAEGSLRISISAENTEAEIQEFLEVLKQQVQLLNSWL